MATNIDFDTLINRIDVATNTLEVTVGELDQSIDSVGQAVDEAEAFAHAAEIAATAAQDFVAQAAQEAIAADQARQDAVQAKQDAQNIVAAFSQAHVVEEAPINGVEYVRKDGAWVVNTGGEGGGGDVISVNNKLPDAQGNISIEYEDIPNTPSLAPVATSGSYTDLSDKPTLATVATSGSYNDLSDKPTIPSQGVLSIVAGSNITVDNTDPLNPVISATGGGGGGGGGGFPIDGQDAWNGWFYNGVLLEEYPFTNPNKALNMALLTHMEGGRLKTLLEMINSARSINSILVKLPDCNLWASGIKLGSLTTRSGVGRLTVGVVGSTTIPFLTFTDSVSGITYVWENAAKTFTRNYN